MLEWSINADWCRQFTDGEVLRIGAQSHLQQFARKIDASAATDDVIGGADLQRSAGEDALPQLEINQGTLYLFRCRNADRGEQRVRHFEAQKIDQQGADIATIRHDRAKLAVAVRQNLGS